MRPGSPTTPTRPPRSRPRSTPGSGTPALVSASTPAPGPACSRWGQAPTANGSLAVRWAQDTTGQFHLQVTVPSSTSGEVWVPLATAAQHQLRPDHRRDVPAPQRPVRHLRRGRRNLLLQFLVHTDGLTSRSAQLSKESADCGPLDGGDFPCLLVGRL
ncbi:alpha-L-rhamnosidase C-terminal domain-containing protein [Nonomuraea sp. NPDC002799]